VEKFDLIWVHTSLAAFFVRLAVVMAGKGNSKVVNTVHGYLFDDNTPPLKRAILLAAERLTAGVTDLVITMNRYDFELAAGERLAKRIASVDGAGVDFAKFAATGKEAARKALGLPENAFIMIYAAEFSKRKNQSFLIECMGALTNNILLLLAGRGALDAECRALVEKAGLSGRVIFAGHVADLSPYYSAADVCVSSSRSEGLPFNVMESMYFSLPVVATRVKGHVDLIDEGRNGYLYAYGDKSGFIAHIERLAEDEDLRRRLGACARSSVMKYSLDRVLPAAFELIEQYLSL
jgi:glycosyltransferase EpsD